MAGYRQGAREWLDEKCQLICQLIFVSYFISWIRIEALAMKNRCSRRQTKQYRSIDALYETGERCYKAKRFKRCRITLGFSGGAKRRPLQPVVGPT
jgi:hypothetical protein